MMTDDKANNESWDLIHVYTRAEAIADGVLIDVTDIARETGFRFPVAMTTAAWFACVDVPLGLASQDETGRLWDVLNVLMFTIRSSKDDCSRLSFRVSVLNEHGKFEQVELKSICGPGDNLEPVVTILLPNED